MILDDLLVTEPHYSYVWIIRIQFVIIYLTNFNRFKEKFDAHVKAGDLQHHNSLVNNLSTLVDTSEPHRWNVKIVRLYLYLFVFCWDDES